MNIGEAIDYVKLLLGGRHINLEIEDTDIEVILNSAVAKLTSFVDLTDIKEVPALDVQEFEATDVIRVYNNRNVTLGTDLEIDLFSTYLFANRDVFSTSIKDSIIYRGYSSMANDSILRSFKYIGNKLYLYNYTGLVTVEYIPKNISFETLGTKYQDWVIRYSKVLCKEVLGRIRSKYKSSSSPFELDGDTLLNELENEKQQLLEEISNEGLYFIDTD